MLGILRFLLILLVGRILLGVFRAISRQMTTTGPGRRRSPQAPDRGGQPRRRPAGDIVDAEFEDIESGQR